MTETEIFLVYFIVFQQVLLFLLIALQKSINNTVKETIELMQKGQQP